MIDLQQLNWFQGNGNKVEFEEIITICKNFVKKGSKIFIGTDSFKSKRDTNFATAICLYGSGNQSRYFYVKDRISTKKRYYNILSIRITEEVRRSVELAEHLTVDHSFSYEDIELHLDVSPVALKNGTSKLSEALTGYVVGAGFECRVKPEAWASQTVADKHSK